ncbi:RNA-directed DNA polymerase, eukaryota, reverse transcriptase zinc-binding domain protein [Tanacetum coccineum]
MVKWIMVCLNSASFSICINGESHGFSKAKRGLRQGDPVSPYLFTIVMEVFTLMLRRQVSKEVKFKYHWGCKNLVILNLCFADDLMLFCHGDIVSASVLRRALDEFCLSLGLRPNTAKSTVYFGNVREDVKNNIMIAMPFREGSFPSRYLGIPLGANIIIRDDCTVLMDKIKKRVEDWRNKSLSFAGRLQIIASVLSLFNIDGKRNIRYSVAWNEVCMQKSKGGLGLKSIHVWNVALWLNTFGMPLLDMFILKTKVVDLVLDGEWRWLGDWNFRFKELLDIPAPSLIDNHKDRVF